MPETRDSVLSPLALYFWAALAGLIGGVGDALLNVWAKYRRNEWWWLVGGYIGWNIALTIFLWLLVKKQLLAQAAAVFTAANGFLIAVMCWTLFQEEMSLTSWIGILVVFCGIVLLELGK